MPKKPPPSLSIGTTPLPLPPREPSDEQKRKAEQEFKKHLERQKELKEFGDFKDDLFDLIREIGRGNGGSVELVVHKKAQIQMARKIIVLEVNDDIRRQIIRELKVLEECNFNKIVGFYGSYQSRQSTQISICMEYLDGGSLDKMIQRYGRLPEEICGVISASVLDGLDYLKKHHNIIHRDVKPSNVLVNTKGDIKLCDFGVSGQLINSIAKSFVGTRSYMAPERLQGNQHGIASDIWSLGLTIVELALGKYAIPAPTEAEINELMSLEEGTPPRKSEEIRHTIFELLMVIVDQEPPKLPNTHFSQGMVDFIDMCLQRQPENRATLETLLNQDFVAGFRQLDIEIIANFVKKTLV